MENKSKYREEYESKLHNVKESESLSQNILKSNLENFDELKKVSYLEGEEVDAALLIIQDKSKNVNIRSELLEKISAYIGKRQDILDITLSILKDTTEPSIIRIIALNSLQVISFQTVLFAAIRPRYLEALRNLVIDNNNEIKSRALEILAQNKDEYIQRRLFEGLKNPDQALVAPEKAIQLLGYDIHAEYYPLLRDIVQSSPNEESKIEAIRLLSADSQSRELLLNLMKDKEQPLVIRNQCSVAVQTLAPAEFKNIAKQAILDENEDEGLKAICLNALSIQSKVGLLPQDQEFDYNVQKIYESAISSELKKASFQYMKIQNNQ